MYDQNDRDFWQDQAEKNAYEIAQLRQALRQEREVRASYRALLDCYEAALHACLEVPDER